MTVRASGRNAELGAAMAEMQMRMEMRGGARQQQQKRNNQSRISNAIRTKFLLSSNSSPSSMCGASSSSWGDTRLVGAMTSLHTRFCPRQLGTRHNGRSSKRPK